MYREDRWSYNKGSGGGRTRVWEGSTQDVLEKAGVNFSLVSGAQLPKSSIGNNAAEQASVEPFTATGVSIVLHPSNPMVPTIHMNIRYIETNSKWWFGGGIDLTPYYPIFEEIKQFHQTLKDLCEEHGQSYEKHKKTCDDYFTLKHRNEMRGVGGIFFDALKASSTESAASETSAVTKKQLFEFVIGLGMVFTKLYEPFLRHQSDPFVASQREYQLWRRSRYVEFNLLWDRGTKFGIESDGRTESILMSLPSIAKWFYDYYPTEGTIEGTVHRFYLRPQEWTTITKEVLPKSNGLAMDAALQTSDGLSAKSMLCNLLQYALPAFASGFAVAYVLIKRQKK